MNERIVELAKQCGYWSGQTIEMNDVGIEKFAQLIVERIIDNVECHASLFNTKEARQVCSWIVKSVKYDFGVL